MATAATDCSWFPSTEGEFVPWWGSLAKRLLAKWGTTPRHIAFILDGNRRFARTHHLASAIEGHAAGFARLTRVLDWCRELDVREVTIYAFSIENFKRSSDEVAGLLSMADERFEQLLAEEEKLTEKQIRFRFFGRRSLLTKNLQQKMARIEELTKDYDKASINVCLAYTATTEMTDAMNDVRRGVQQGLITEADIDDDLLESCLSTGASLPVDMIVRTSGEHRLSDFLLWQASNCYVHFEDILWPDFDFWHLVKAVYGYQRNLDALKAVEKPLSSTDPVTGDAERKAAFLDWLHEERRVQRQGLINQG